MTNKTLLETLQEKNPCTSCKSLKRIFCIVSCRNYENYIEQLKKTEITFEDIIAPCYECGHFEKKNCPFNPDCREYQAYHSKMEKLDTLRGEN